MKSKFSSIWRVAIALVMVLSFSLVTAVPVSADITDGGGSKTEDPSAPELTGFDPQFVKSATSTTYTVTIEDEGIDLTPSQKLADVVVIHIPDSAGLSVWSSTVGCTATVTSNTGDVIGNVTTVNDAATPPQVSEIHVELEETSGAAAEVSKIVVEFTSSSPSVGSDTSYTWDVVMNDAVSASATGTASVTVDPDAPTITGITGTSYQSGNDAIVITFSEAVAAADGTWDESGEFSYIKCGETTLATTENADFTLDTTGKILTVTLDQDTEKEWLTNGEYIKVKPATYVAGVSGISDLAGNALSDTEETSAQVVSGDTVDPTVAVTYTVATPPVKEGDTPTITATFSEAMQDFPQISIVAEDLTVLQTATGMTESADRKVWTFSFTVPAGNDGTATVTITGSDLAGNPMTDSANTFVIDNTRPTIADTDIVGTTIEGEDDTIVITFSEAVKAKDGNWGPTGGNEFTSIYCGTTELDLTGASFEEVDPVDGLITTLKISLLEANAYLVNDETITLTLAGGANAIQDAAENEMLSGVDNKIVGTMPVSGDVVVPAITTIVGTVKDGADDTIDVYFSEAVRAADGEWSANEFALIESPNGAPLNINHASFGISGTVLTITLNKASDGAFLVEGNAVCVTPALNAIVDLAGNPVAAVEVSSADAAVPTITDVVGTSIQDAGDTVVITFSEPVEPVTDWLTAFPSASIDCGTTSLTLTKADFVIDGTNTVLTITLDEATDGAYLVNGETVKVSPADSQIKDADGNFVATDPVESAEAVDGDVVLPTITSIVGTIIPGSGSAEKDIIVIDFSEAVDVTSWVVDAQFTIENAVLTGASFSPAGGITTSLTITLATGADLTAGDTLTVTPVMNEILDLAGNAMSVDPIASAAPVQAPSEKAFGIDLEAGWNLISLPLIPTDSDIETVLADLTVSGTVMQVRTFLWEADVLGEKYWIPTGSTLSQMVDGQGYWVEMSAADILFVAGSEQAPPGGMQPSYDLHVGWNLIGFKSLTPADPTEYLDELAMRAIYGFNATAGTYFIPKDIGEGGPQLAPGKGYWVAVSEAGTIYP